VPPASKRAAVSLSQRKVSAPVRRRGGRPSQQEAAQLADRILDAATDLFFARGYGATSIEAVAQRARVSKRTFYHRFDDKATLFGAVLHRIIQGLRPPPAMPIVTGAGLAEILRRLAGLIVHAAVTPQALALHRLIVGESARFPKLAAAVTNEGATREAIALIANILAREARAGISGHKCRERTSTTAEGKLAASFRLASPGAFMTDRYAVIGNPIGHSKSPLIHGSFARNTGQDLEYGIIESTPDGFVTAVDAFRAAGGRGMNVTTPFKVQAYDLAGERLPRAKLAGAANALKFDGGRIVADNFDGVGLVNDIERNLGVALAGKRVLVLGAGGAARGALLPLLAQQPTEIVICNRHVDKARVLAADVAADGRVVACGYADLAGHAFDVVLNATSASLHGEMPPIAKEVFGDGALAYDFVYGRGLTPFLELARAAGKGKVADGVGMLVEQAAEAFVWWRGVRPDTRGLIAILTIPLA